MIAELKEVLATPIDSAPLAAFRFLFGLLMGIFELRQGKFRRQFYTETQFFIPFPIALNFPIPSGQVAAWLSIVSSLSFFAFGLGLLHPFSLLLGFGIYLYFFLIEQSNYNNHYYLILLIGLLMLVVDSSGDGPIPWWQLLIFQLQLFIVYFYGGLAKVQSDWLLRAHPLHQDLLRCNPPNWLRPVAHSRALAYVFSWCGMLLDLFIIPLLWWDVTRPWVILPFVVFHLLNSMIFPIGIFPWLNLATLLLFVKIDGVEVLP